jgi:hypothetical protein
MRQRLREAKVNGPNSPKVHRREGIVFRSSPPFFIPRVSRFQSASSCWIVHMQAGKCGNQVSTKYWEVVCDEQSIGGDGKYCGGNAAQLGRINVLYHEASGGKYEPRAVLFDLEASVIGAVSASPLEELFRPGNLVNQKAGASNNKAKAHYRRAGHEFF